MSLRDIVSHADLAVFPEIGLILFFIAFMGVVVRVVRAGDAWDRDARIPLSDEATRLAAVTEEELS